MWTAFAVFLLAFAAGTYHTWELTCAQDWLTGEMNADPASSLGRFCLEQTSYRVSWHFLWWPMPLVAFLVLGSRWVERRDGRWFVAMLVVSPALALLYYSPFLLLPG